jgi:hypothetical protein
LDRYEIKPKANNSVALEGVDDEEDEVDVYEILEQITKDTQLEYHIPSGESHVYIGVSWDKVGENETGKQFKRRVEDLVANVMEQIEYEEALPKCGTHEEAWHD